MLAYRLIEWLCRRAGKGLLMFKPNLDYRKTANGLPSGEIYQVIHTGLFVSSKHGVLWLISTIQTCSNGGAQPKGEAPDFPAAHWIACQPNQLRG